MTELCNKTSDIREEYKLGQDMPDSLVSVNHRLVFCLLYRLVLECLLQ